MMKSVAQGKIFLADQRGIKETPQLKRFSTFNFEEFLNPNKTAINALYLLNDDMLAGGKKTCFEIDIDSYLIVLPITGAVNYLDDTENETDVDVEETAVIYVEKGTNITLSNPFANNIVNYLCIGIKAEEPMPNNPMFFDFNLNTANKLVKINSSSLSFALCIGRFEGRKEAIYQMKKNATLYAKVITGAFEIDGKLLHEKDGLAIWNTEKIELEALSNHAIILTLELMH